MSSKFRFLTSFLYGFEFRQFLPGIEKRYLLHVLRQHHRTHYPKTVQTSGRHPPALIRLLLQLELFIEFEMREYHEPEFYTLSVGLLSPATLVVTSFLARGNIHSPTVTKQPNSLCIVSVGDNHITSIAVSFGLSGTSDSVV